MSDPINFNKARDRADKKAQADANAIKHGRTKAERLADATKAEKARRLLDGHKFDDE